MKRWGRLYGNLCKVTHPPDLQKLMELHCIPLNGSIIQFIVGPKYDEVDFRILFEVHVHLTGLTAGALCRLASDVFDETLEKERIILDRSYDLYMEATSEEA